MTAPRPGSDPGAPNAAGLSAGVIICSYRRPDLLRRCLAGLAAQVRPAEDVIVVVRPADIQSHAVIATAPSGLRARAVAVHEPGLVAARNAGLAALRSDIAVFCDDDTVAPPPWLGQLVAHFAADAALGAAGGRDRCHSGGVADDRRRRMVGKLQWWGRSVGNHHLGFGAARDVDFLKGANMAFRAAAIGGLRFDARLRGTGAQADDDMAFSLAVRRAGWRLLYDPAALLEHYPAEDQIRSYVARPGLADEVAYEQACFNHALVIAAHLPPFRRRVYKAWAALIGTCTHPGLLQALRFRLRGDRAAWRKFRLNQRALAEIAAMAAAADADDSRSPQFLHAAARNGAI